MQYFRRNKNKQFIFIGMLILAAQSTSALDEPSQAFPLNARVIGDLSAARIGIADAEVLWPLYGNDEQIYFFDAQGNVGSDGSWMGSAGLGIRSVVNDWIWGAYLFGDRDADGFGGKFWVVNPGIEFMNANWDAHLNGYIPTNTKTQLTDIDVASNLGITDFIRFEGHSELDSLIARYSVVGNGIDGEVGYSIPMMGNRGRVYVGGYYYWPSKNSNNEIFACSEAQCEVENFGGVQGGLEVPINTKTSLKLGASHDQVYGNQGRLSVSFKFGAIPQQQPGTVKQRILDPIVRHEGTLATASGIVSQQKILQQGDVVLFDNIWFFKPGTSSMSSVTRADCTFENPCTGINTDVINSIDNIDTGARLYLDSGDYINSAFGSGFTLNNGQTIWGREDNYRNRAEGDARATLEDTLFLDGNNIVDSLQVHGGSDGGLINGTASTPGVEVLSTATGTVLIDNSVLHTTTTTLGSHYTTGLSSFATNIDIQVKDSVLQAEATEGLADSVVMLNSGPGTARLTINDSTLLSSIITDGSFAGAMFVENLDGGRTITSIEDSQLSITNAGNGTNIFGILNRNTGSGSADLSIKNSSINTVAAGNNSTIGIFNRNRGTGTATTSIDNVIITGASGRSIVGVSNINDDTGGTGTGTATTFVNNSVFNVTSTGTGAGPGFQAIGINNQNNKLAVAGGTANVFVANSTINATGLGNNTPVIGIANANRLGTANTTVENSSINAISNGTNSSAQAVLNNNIISGNATFTTNNSAFLAEANGTNGISLGFSNRNNSPGPANATFNANDSSFIVNANGSTGVATGVINQSSGPGIGNATATVEDSQFTVSANGINGISTGVNNTRFGTHVAVVNVIHTTIDVNAIAGMAVGMQNNPGGTINLTDQSTINVNALIPTLFVGTITSDNTNTCSVNGVTGPC